MADRRDLRCQFVLLGTQEVRADPMDAQHGLRNSDDHGTQGLFRAGS